MRFCGACGAPLAESAPATSEGEAAGTQRRHVTIMFCDLVGSTQLAERLDPEDFREVISGYQAVCSGAIQHFGGYVAQYQGDGVVAYFGYPSAHEDDARRAVHASLEIFGKLSALNERLREPAQRALQARVGLHTGTVITDDTEGWAHDRHSVVGQSVNIAARLQALARPGSIVATDCRSQARACATGGLLAAGPTRAWRARPRDRRGGNRQEPARACLSRAGGRRGDGGAHPALLTA